MSAVSLGTKSSFDALRRYGDVWEVSMRRSDYRERAVAYFRLAKSMVNPAHRTKLLEMALAWLRLADQAETNAQADLVYETPPGAVPSPVPSDGAAPDQMGAARLRRVGR